MRRIVTSLVFVVILCIPGQAGMLLTVDQAINLALENNESYLNAKQELVKAKNQVYEVRSSAFPQLNSGLDIVRNWEVPSIIFGEDTYKMGSDYNWTWDLTVTQPIYNGGSVFAAWSVAKMYNKYSRHKLNMQTRELKLDVIKAYYGVVMADELERVAKQTVELAQANLDVVKMMSGQGTVSDFEVLMAEVRLANFKPAYIEAKANSKIAHQSLNNMIGLDMNEAVDVVWEMDSTMFFVPDYDLDSLKTAASANRPEIYMSDLNTKMLKKAITVARSGYRPKINFLTSLQYQAQYDGDKWPDRRKWIRNYYSGISIDIPIFDSWKTPSQVKQAKIEYSQASLSQMEIEDNLKLDIEHSWWKYQEARENFATQGQAVEMAKRGLSIAQVRFQNGVGTQLELFEAEVALSTAENNRVMAFYDLVTGYATLMKAIGEDELLR